MESAVSYVTENWATIAAILALIGSLLKSAKVSRVLNAVIAGVESYCESVGSDNVKRSIRFEATERGVEKPLNKAVRRETGRVSIALLGLAVLLAVVLIPGCQTPTVGGGSGPAGTSEGGKATTTPVQTAPNVAFAQPGSDANALQLNNTDQLGNSNAGDAPILVFGGGGAAALMLLNKPDPVADMLAAQYTFASEKQAEAVSPEDRDFWIARADAQIKALAEHEVKKLEAAQGIAGSFDKLTNVVFAACSIRIAGVSPEKLPAETVRAIATGVAEGVKPFLQKIALAEPK